MYVSLFVIVFSTLTCVIFRLHQKKRFSTRGKNKKKEEVFYVSASSSRASTKKSIPIVIA